MTSIKDGSFITTLYRRFCHHRVSDRASRLAIQGQHVEVHDLGDGRLKVSICDCEGSFIDLGWHSNVGASVLQVEFFDRALRDVDTRALTGFVRRFLRRHDVIDSKGLPFKRSAA